MFRLKWLEPYYPHVGFADRLQEVPDCLISRCLVIPQRNNVELELRQQRIAGRVRAAQLRLVNMRGLRDRRDPLCLRQCGIALLELAHRGVASDHDPQVIAQRLGLAEKIQVPRVERIKRPEYQYTDHAIAEPRWDAAAER